MTMPFTKTLDPISQTSTETARLSAFTATIPQEASAISGYSIIHTGTQDTKAYLTSPKGLPRQSAPEPPPQAKNDAIRRNLKRATDCAHDFATAADPMQRANAGFSLRDTLQILWEFRTERETDWGDLLNLLQGLLNTLELERLSDAQCHALYSIVKDRLAGVPLERDDIAHALRDLRGVGLDPWAAISAEPTTEE